MPNKRQRKKTKRGVERVKLTARVTLEAYNAITEMQRRYRARTGKALRIWEVIDAATIAYVKQQGIRVGE